MKVLYAADLHGKETLYTQLDEIVKAEKPEILLLGGDLFPEDPDVQKTPLVQKSFVVTEFLPRFRSYPAFGVKEVLIIMGNHDLTFCERTVEDMEKNGLCRYLHGREVTIGDLRFVGYSYSPPSPYLLRDFDKKDTKEDEVPELCLLPDNTGYVSKDLAMIKVKNREFFRSRGTIAEDLGLLEKQITGKGYILVSHAPPACEYLDLETPTLHVGSKAIRRFIKRTRPRFALHGHIHFAPKNSGGHFLEKVEGVLCVNPGQKFSQLYAVVFDTENFEKSIRHTVFK